MDLLIGEYRNTLDEKGRISFPSKLRAALTQDSLIIAKSLDSRCGSTLPNIGRN